MNTTFHDAIGRVLGHEGEYVNHPADPGGETNWGISKRTYPNVDIRALTRDAAIEIYKRDFWDAVGGDALPTAVAYQAMDFAVNSGVQTAIRALQRAIGVADDGHFGPASKQAAAGKPASDIVLLLLAERLQFMTGLRGWTDFGRGWARRIAANLRYGAQDT